MAKCCLQITLIKICFFIQIDDDDDGVTPWVDRSSEKKKPEPAQKHTAIDVTAEDILPRLNSQNVADLVLLSMVSVSVLWAILFMMI